MCVFLTLAGRTRGKVPAAHPCRPSTFSLLTAEVQLTAWSPHQTSVRPSNRPLLLALLAAEDEACLARYLVHQGPLGRLKATLLTCLVDTSRVSKEHSAPVRAKAVRALGSVIEADTRLLAAHTVVQGASSALQVGCLHWATPLADRPPKLSLLPDMRNPDQRGWMQSPVVQTPGPYAACCLSPLHLCSCHPCTHKCKTRLLSLCHCCSC